MRAPEREARRLQRLGWPVETHLSALDGDMDTMEGSLDRLATEVKRLTSVLAGLMVTIAGAAVVGALNLLFGGK